MNTYTEYIDELISKLMLLEPYRIILFGSRASGAYSEDSDIDLCIVLDSDRVPQTYAEKMQNKLMVRNQVTDINEHVPIDFIVYTKAEYNILAKNNVSFINEIQKSGKIMYEKASGRLA